MNIFNLFRVVTVLSTLQYSRTQRRIIDGETIQTDKRFMAYLVKAPVSPQKYDAWVCGGSIITHVLILTSAACIEDIQYMYAIAGYKKYVPAHEIKTDACTSKAKKKVVLTCLPKTYDFAYSQIEKWSNIDIGVVRVESPYEFDATAPIAGCSWVPDMIEINHIKKYQEPGTDALVMGWGHKEKWRKTDETIDHNQQMLQFTRVLIKEIDECKEQYKFYKNILPIIDKYMICSNGVGNIGETGEIVEIPNPADAECGSDKNSTVSPLDGQGPTNETRSDKTLPYVNRFDYRRNNSDDAFDNDTFIHYPTRRHGICQNDHGGPLLTWVGSKLRVIGVASVFLVNAKDFKCTGPFLYTSTFCSGKFLGCTIKSLDNETESREGKQCVGNKCFLRSDPDSVKRREILARYDSWFEMNKKFCDLPAAEKGFSMIQRRISWAKHPDGPAESEPPEDLLERPQIPLNYLRSHRNT